MKFTVDFDCTSLPLAERERSCRRQESDDAIIEGENNQGVSDEEKLKEHQGCNSKSNGASASSASSWRSLAKGETGIDDKSSKDTSEKLRKKFVNTKTSLREKYSSSRSSSERSILSSRLDDETHKDTYEKLRKKFANTQSSSERSILSSISSLTPNDPLTLSSSTLFNTSLSSSTLFDSRTTLNIDENPSVVEEGDEKTDDSSSRPLDVQFCGTGFITNRSTGEVYEGPFISVPSAIDPSSVRLLRHGREATCTYPNGMKFEGDFEWDRPKKGTWTNGEEWTYEGTFVEATGASIDSESIWSFSTRGSSVPVESKFHLIGTRTPLPGSVLFHGTGRFSRDGYIYHGEFSYGLAHGWGKETLSNKGVVFRGKFCKGMRVMHEC
jgi:hypothetical protein